MAALRPSVFAAASPQGVYGIFQQAADPVDLLQMKPYTRWQLARWDLRSYLPNASGVPMQIIFGHKDRTTPALNALVFKHLLEYYHGGQAEALGFDAPHNITYPQYKWSDTRKWLLRHKRAPTSRGIHARTATLRYNRFGWVTVDAMEDYWKIADVKVFLPNGARALMLEATNVRRLTLRPPEPVRRVSIAGNEFRAPSEEAADGGCICVSRDPNGTWSVLWGKGDDKRSTSDANSLRKVHGRSGPIWDFCFRPVAIVYGTGGSPRETAGLKKVAASLQRMDNTWGPAPWPIVKDTDVTEKMKRQRNLILVGDTKTNALLKGGDWPFDPVAGKLPMLEGDAKPKRGMLQFIWPSPFAKQRYVYAVSPLNRETIDPWVIRPQNTWSPLTWADWAVVAPRENGRGAGTLADGVFDGNWQYQAHDGKTMRPRYMNWER
jgi:hypothetical protein